MRIALVSAIIISLAYQALKAEPIFTAQVSAITIHEAMVRGVKSQPVFKCEEVVLKVNKSSVSLTKKK